MDDLVDASGGYAESFGQTVLCEGKRLEELLVEDLSGVNGRKSFSGHVGLLVVVHDLDVVGVVVNPAKADAPLVIDADAVLSRAVSGQFLEAIGGRCPEVDKTRIGIERHELAQRDALQVGR
jgi:hypothetical protein